MFAEQASSIGGDTTLVLLHGAGSDERDLLGLAPELDPRLRIRSYRAPFEMGDLGYVWFPIEFRTDGSRGFDGEASTASLKLLTAELERLGSDRLIVGGFSQGGMMAAAALMTRPDLVSAAWIMSGMLLPNLAGSEPISRPILIQHGEFDPVIPIQAGNDLAEALTSQGHSVEFRRYPMAHQVSQESVACARAWMARLPPR